MRMVMMFILLRPIGTAKQMVDLKSEWSGTLMLIAQPAEERVLGARNMMDENLWERFGKPDYALAFHVSSMLPSGIVNVVDGSPYAGADTVDIYVHGIGAHGASPHAGRSDCTWQSNRKLVADARIEELPRDNLAWLQLAHSIVEQSTISFQIWRTYSLPSNTNDKTHDTLLSGIKRISENLGQAAGLPEDKLPEVVVSEESTPPTINDTELANRLKNLWQEKMGINGVTSYSSDGMGLSFPFFTRDHIYKRLFCCGWHKPRLF